MSDIDDGEVVSGGHMTTIEQVTRGEIDMQVRTAKNYARSITTFTKQAKEWVTLDESVAESCMYALKRGGKTIEGPSARFAEIIASAWGNCRSGARIVDEDDRFVTAQGVFHDLERNVAITFEVRRRITDKDNRKYSDDMIGVTSNAASSIAMRNAVLKGIPKAFWQAAYQAARECAIGDAHSLTDKRLAAVGYFQKMGVTDKQIFATLGVAGIEEITLDHLALLKGFVSRLKEGEPIEVVFADESAPLPTSKKRVAVSTLQEAIAKPEAAADKPPA